MRFEFVPPQQNNTSKKHRITAVNDGGLIVRYYPPGRAVDWQPGGVRPVFSVEVKLCTRNTKYSHTDQTHACQVTKFHSG
jgi:hypothetical protein